MQVKSSLSRGARASSALALPLAATGVVFRDIGTSPLYALRACFSDVSGMSVDALSVLGILSIIFCVPVTRHFRQVRRHRPPRG